MHTIADFENDPFYQTLLKITRANTSDAYGGLQLHNGKRNYLQQIPEEISATLAFFKESYKETPISFLEIGTAANLVNSLFWNYLTLKENVIIDNLMLGGVAESLVGNLSYKMGTVFMIGDSTSENIHAKVKCLNMQYDIIFLDGNHEYDYVKADYAFYSQWLNKGGYFVFHDIDSWRVPGVKQFISEMESENPSLTKVAEFVQKGFKFDAGIAVYQFR